MTRTASAGAALLAAAVLVVSGCAIQADSGPRDIPEDHPARVAVAPAVEGGEATGEGRAINRRDYTTDELLHAFHRPVVKRLIELVRLRNTHPAFDGDLHVENASANVLHMHWRCMDTSCTLRVDLRTGQFSIDERAD